MQHTTQQAQRWHRIRQGLALCIVGIALVVVFTTPLGVALRSLWRDPNPEHLPPWLSSDTSWIPVVLIAFMILHTLVPLPAEILAILAGMMLGPFWGFLTIWVGAMLGAYLGFFLARALGQSLMQRLTTHRRLRRLQGWMPQSDLPLLLAVRLVPVLSFNLVNYALGLTTISWWRFTWTTAVGIIPITAVTVVFGAHMHNWKVLFFLTLGAIVVCLGGFLVVQRRRRRFASFT